MNITPYANWDGSFPALVAGMPESAYHSHPDSISKSGLDLIDRSAAHFRYAARREPTRAMAIGSAIHCALLEPERFASDYLALDVKNRTASEWKQATKARGTDETMLTAPESDHVAGMQESVFANPDAFEALKAASDLRELSVFATDPETGLQVRARADLVATGQFMLDLKKTQDARPEAFCRAIGNYRYFVQAAVYLDVWRWATGETLPAFRFLAVEEQPPHACAVYTLDDEAVAYGRKQYRRNLNEYARCVEQNEWPAYQIESEYIGLPGWMLAEIENEMDDSGIVTE